jgi:hypothetical protein
MPVSPSRALVGAAGEGRVDRGPRPSGRGPKPSSGWPRCRRRGRRRNRTHSRRWCWRRRRRWSRSGWRGGRAQQGRRRKGRCWGCLVLVLAARDRVHHPGLHHLARLEGHHRLLGHMHRGAGLGVTSRARLPPLELEDPKLTELDTVPASQLLDDLVHEDLDDLSGLSRRKTVPLANGLHDLLLANRRHGRLPVLSSRYLNTQVRRRKAHESQRFRCEPGRAGPLSTRVGRVAAMACVGIRGSRGRPGDRSSSGRTTPRVGSRPYSRAPLPPGYGSPSRAGRPSCTGDPRRSGRRRCPRRP